MKDIKKRINGFVREIIETKRHVEEIVNIYKTEMQELAREIVKQTEKIKRLH